MPLPAPRPRLPDLLRPADAASGRGSPPGNFPPRVSPKRLLLARRSCCSTSPRLGSRLFIVDEPSAPLSALGDEWPHRPP